MTLRRVFKKTYSGESSKQSSSGDEAPSKAQSTRAIPVRVLTHNIRYATRAPFKGEEKWPIRCPRLCGELVFHSVVPTTFICLQEVLHQQLLDVKDHLNQDEAWEYIGVGRDDGKQAGEYSPILYRPSEWKLNGWSTVWLSETPSKPSFGWDAGCIRLVTIGNFTHFHTGQGVIIASTHFDDRGVISRKESAKMLPGILETEAKVSQASATILAGDFNSPPSDEAYQIVTGPESTLTDVWDLIPEERQYGNQLTFTGFSDESEPSRIDFIFSRKSDLTNNGGILKVKNYAVLSNRFDDGVYSSDHRACVADFDLLPQ